MSLQSILFRAMACLAMLGAAGCTSRYSVKGLPERDPEGPHIWKVSPAPTPLGGLVLLPGETRRVPLRGALEDAIGCNSYQRVGDNPEAAFDKVDFAAESMNLAVGKASHGGGVLLLSMKLRGGGNAECAVPYLIRPYPIVSFSYQPEAGKSPKRVFVAGAFNGWSGSKNELARGADGVFRLDLPVAAGNWTYKFVVDGDWVADPGNPKTDGSGYGNSVLVVEGPPDETLRFVFLSSEMPYSGQQGAFRLVAPDGAKLDADSVIVVQNNRRVTPQEFVVDAENGVVRLAVSPRFWLSENFVVVFARDTDGRPGLAQARADSYGAPRSPRDEVLYFAMTDRFFDGNPANNPKVKAPVASKTPQAVGKPEGGAKKADAGKKTEAPKPDPALDALHPLADYHGGDWAGVRQKIDDGYFDRLGVTTIWVSPANRQTMKVERDALPPRRLFSSYHAYWPISFDQTNPPFGTARDLSGMIDSAHEHGMAVLLDYVANHVHRDHPLLKQHPTWITPNKTPDGRPNIRLFDEFPFTTWFDEFLPTLEFHNNPELAKMVTDDACLWLDRTGADGFRFDAVKHVDPLLWHTLADTFNKRYAVDRGQSVFQIGETISDRNTISKFVGPDLLTGQFDFPVLFAIQGQLAKGQGSMKDLAGAALQSQSDYPPYAIMSPLLGNHDVARFMGMADGDLPEGNEEKEKEIAFTNPPQVDDPASYSKLRLAFGFLFFLPGPPTIYYGDEIGMTGAHDPDNRRMMSWTGWTADQQTTFDTVASLTRARRDSTALRRGIMEPIAMDDERLVLARISPNDTVLAVFFRKPSESKWELQLPAHWGSPVALYPMAGSGLDAKLGTRGELEISGAAWSWGFWRIRW